MHALLPVRCHRDILPAYCETPIGYLLEYHNLCARSRSYDQPELIVGMCLDNRHQLCIPDNFAFFLRTGGADFRHVEFQVSYAIAVGGIRHLCLIGHDDCGMVDLQSRRDALVRGLVGLGGRTVQDAEEHIEQCAAEFETGDSRSFILAEAQRIRQRYPRIVVAPLFYKVEEGMLYQLVAEEHTTSERNWSRPTPTL